MELSSLSSKTAAAPVRLDQLAHNTQLSQPEKVAEVARQFEAVLLRQILTDAQKKMFPSPLNPESSSTGIYQDMITNNLAESLSQSGGFGLARVLAQQLHQQIQPPPAPAEGAAKV